jgi:hypothetical protein
MLSESMWLEYRSGFLVQECFDLLAAGIQRVWVAAKGTAEAALCRLLVWVDRGQDCDVMEGHSR